MHQGPGAHLLAPPQVQFPANGPKCLSLAMRGRTRYTFAIRVKPDGVSYKGYWSAWSEPVSLVTPSGTWPGRDGRRMQLWMDQLDWEHLGAAWGVGVTIWLEELLVGKNTGLEGGMGLG